MGSKKKILVISSLLLLFFTVSCNGAGKEPTIDANLIYTQAAQTVEAQLTEAAALVPTATNTIPPTATELPPTPTILSLGQSTTGTPVPLFTMPSSGTFTSPLTGTQPVGGPTATVLVKVQGDKAKFYYSHPADGAKMGSNVGFTFIIGMGNVGSTTWNTNYRIVFTGGTQITTAMSFPLEWETAPGSTAEFYIPARTPAEPGSYTTYFQVVNQALSLIHI